MNFKKIEILGSQGQIRTPFINLDTIMMTVPLDIPTGMCEADGETPITKKGLGLMAIGGTVIPTTLTEKTFRELIGLDSTYTNPPFPKLNVE